MWRRQGLRGPRPALLAGHRGPGLALGSGDTAGEEGTAASLAPFKGMFQMCMHR